MSNLPSMKISDILGKNKAPKTTTNNKPFVNPIIGNKDIEILNNLVSPSNSNSLSTPSVAPQPSKPMTFNVGEGMTPQQTAEAYKTLNKGSLPAPNIFTSPFSDVISHNINENIAKIKTANVLEKKNPLRAMRLESLAATGNLNKAVRKKKITPEEAWAFSVVPQIQPAVTGVHFISPQEASNLLAESGVSKLTRQDLKDIATGRITSGPKYRIYEAVASSPRHSEIFHQIATNEKIPLRTKIGDYLRKFIKFTPKETRFAEKSIKKILSSATRKIILTGTQNENILIKLGHQDWIGKTIPKQDYINALKQVIEKAKPVSPETGIPNEIGKPKTIFKLTPQEKTRLLGKKPATPQQIRKAHVLAREKAYLSEKGKVKPQYRRLALGMTGKKSIQQMTQEEAGRFIDALSKLPNPTIKGGKTIPPSIPKLISLTPKGFFNHRGEISVFNNFIEPKTLDRKTLDTSKMAIRTTKSGNRIPSIRKSGFYATKDIENADIKDIYAQSESPHHMALMQDNYHLGDKFGTIYKKVWKPTKEAVVKSKEDKITFDREFKDILKKHKVKITRKNGELLSDWLEKKKTIPEKYKNFVEDVRGFLDKQRQIANKVREAMGKPKIRYIQNYVPHLQKSVLWNEFLSNRATISDNLDFIVPNQVKNPFAFRRLLKEMPNAERNFFRLIDRYNSAVSKDINITPAIENIKAYNSVLKDRGLFNASRYWDEYIREGLIGKQHKMDTALSIGYKGRRALQKWNSMVNQAFLTGKIAWNIATQPLSYITLTPTEAGYWNATKAVFKMFNGGIRRFARKNSLSLKIKSDDILANAVGENRSAINGIYKTPIDKWNNAISLIGSTEEQILHEASFIAGLDRAKQLGYKGQDAIDFADLIAERTQSMYNKENRALILNSDAAKAVFPFQSFATEMFNHAKEIAGANGAMKMKLSQRIGKLFRLIVGIYLANLYSKAITGRKKTTVGTFIPFFGQFVDALISKATGEELYSGRSPFTAIQQAEEIIKGAKDYLKYGSLRRLRKVGVNFGLAALGIGGGAQLNNIIDGTMADINEEVKSANKKRLFGVTDTISKIKAPIFGVWSTRGGRKYWEKRSGKAKKKVSAPTIGSGTMPSMKMNNELKMPSMKMSDIMK